jgi:hypothetical protein
MSNISALKDLYTSLGGSLTDSYDDIADGAKVSDYSQIADGICACAKVSGANGSLTFKGTTNSLASSCSIGENFDSIITALEDGKNVQIVLYYQSENPAEKASRLVLTIGNYRIGEGAYITVTSTLGDDDFSPFVLYGEITAENAEDFALQTKIL